jgi:hypothetical protein
LYIGKDRINPIGWGADHNISMNSFRPGSFQIPNDVNLPEELVKEYELKCEGPSVIGKMVLSHYCWYSHNVGDLNRIFYKNLVMKIDNAVVRRKYSQQDKL